MSQIEQAQMLVRFMHGSGYERSEAEAIISGQFPSVDVAALVGELYA